MQTNLINLQSSETSVAQIVAHALIEGCNEAVKDRVSRIKNLWETLWENERALPAEILNALGSNATRVFQAAGLARNDLEAIAALANATAANLLGNEKYLTPALPVTYHADGTVTLTNA